MGDGRLLFERIRNLIHQLRQLIGIGEALQRHAENGRFAVAEFRQHTGGFARSGESQNYLAIGKSLNHIRRFDNISVFVQVVGRSLDSVSETHDETEEICQESAIALRRAIRLLHAQHFAREKL